MDINERRNETFQQMHEILDDPDCGKCAVIRPCGFGKTGIATRLITEYVTAGLTVQYLYPAAVVKNAVLDFYYGKDRDDKMKHIRGVTFLTYMGLVRRFQDGRKLYSGPVDLIVLDECHMAGAKITKKAVHALLDMYPKAKLLGLTATPQRSDSTDEIKEFFSVDFNGKKIPACVPDYTLHDAFEDGLFQKPYYVCCNYADAKKNGIDIRKQPDIQKALEGLDDESRFIIEKGLDEQMIAMAKIWNVPNTIRKNCDSYAADTSYMKFIVFFRNFRHMKENGKKIRRWFHEAYPDHKITTLTVSSETSEYHNNVTRLSHLIPMKNHIDLIYACDMLNLGYHVDNITGIVMFRRTKSPIIYPQQFGRVISSERAKGGLIFDMVDNIGQMAEYSILEHKSVYTTTAWEAYMQLVQQKEEYDAYTIWKKDPEAALQTIDADTKKRFEEYDKKPETAPQWTHVDEQEYRYLSKRFSRKEQKPKDDDGAERDLIAVGKFASYKDILRKTVMEASVIRARKAALNWLECGGQLKDENGIPYTRAEIVKHLPPKYVPLAPFCKIKRVAMEAVMDELQIPEETQKALEAISKDSPAA